jgi:signal transduction histidine kinase/ActR/RegA family two-component response regulator
VRFATDESADGLSVEVVPLDVVQTRCLVLFEPKDATTQPAETPDPAPEEDPRDREISRLKRQLTAAKERFLSAIEAHQSSREESQNTTEEALSANEELQSLNEELETAKEELQSSNEELVTVNDELQHKNADLAQARDFAFSIVETIRQPLVVLDTDLRIRMANRAFYRTFQISPQDAEGHAITSLSHGSWDLPGLQDALAGLVHDGNSFPDFEVEQEFTPFGRRTLVLGGCRINHLKMILLAIDDVTERRLAQHALKRTEDNLRQSQKMEAVGRLAGGIAHDFNNLLTAVIGYSSLLEDRLAADPSALQHVLQIKIASDRAISLTQQLLSFSRRQILQPKVLDLNVVVAEFEKMLRRLVGERIKIVLKCAPSLWQVRADPGEVGRAIMNLSLNARDAMPEGGTLTIETANLVVAAGDGNEDLEPGRFVTLSVRDTGIGIDEEVLAHIFEPFFTTKETGKGTGLGLATVLGVVEQSGGVIRCESRPAGGTTFRIFLPAIAEPAATRSPVAGGLSIAAKGTEVILLVEDEEAVRKLARIILERSGYVVREAPNGREGLALCETYDGEIDLLLTDVVMPELGGRELADAAVKLRPGMKVLFMSGHTQDVVIKEGVQKGMAFLQKPFTPAVLAEKVRQTLDRERVTAVRPTEFTAKGTP